MDTAAPITIKTIRLDSISIQGPTDVTGCKIRTGAYALMSTDDKALASAEFFGAFIDPSPATVAAMEMFMASYKADIIAAPGLMTWLNRNEDFQWILTKHANPSTGEAS